MGGKSAELLTYKIKKQQAENTIYKIKDLIILPTVKADQNRILIREIADEEIKKAISNLKPNKATRPDGYPSEWYKDMKDLLIPIMKVTYNHVLKTGRTPPSWREAVISSIPKESKDTLECGSYRPISVLNQDYKIFTPIFTLQEDLKTSSPR